MLGAILDVAIGLMLVFLLTSLLCSALQEAIANVTSWRGRSLRAGIQNLLNDPHMTGLADMFYKHPLVVGLTGSRLPSYVSASTFAKVMADIVSQTDAARFGASAGPLAAVMRIADGDPARFKAELEAWYSEAMDRTSGWYKRNVQLVLFVLGLIVAGALNINSVEIGHTLWTRPLLRDLAVAQATEIVARSMSAGENGVVHLTEAGGQAATLPAFSIGDLQKQLDELKMPFGWSNGPPDSVPAWLKTLIGWLITACATSLGSQFWFDTLGKAVKLRAAGPKPQT